LSKKVHFGVPKVDEKTLWLPNFKGRACKLDFPTIHESNLLPALQGGRYLSPKIRLNSIFGAEKSILGIVCLTEINLIHNNFMVLSVRTKLFIDTSLQ